VLNTLDQRIQVKLQWLQEPSQKKKLRYLNKVNVKLILSGTKKSEYLKERTDELAKNSKNKNTRDLYTDIHKFKNDYELTTTFCLQIPIVF
jgi:hypothetical protein